mmetsp:Transcript_139/g.375  ORF Transcript_139/g.375 Transcript_139/m.375 type:complete len:242 (+) Transcript_139:92-817(+)
MLQAACCRCRCLHPLLYRSRLTGLHRDDDVVNEEEEHLLQDVIDSDEEQANPLSPDQIKRYLDETDGKDQQLEPRFSGTSTGSHDASRPMGTRQRVSAPVVDDYDELFDEDFEDEPDKVVVGAKSRPLKLSSQVAPAVAMTMQQDLLDADEDDGPPVIANHRMMHAAAPPAQAFEVAKSQEQDPAAEVAHGVNGTKQMGGKFRTVGGDWAEALAENSSWQAPALLGLEAAEHAELEEVGMH